MDREGQVIVRPMTVADVHRAVELSRALNWPHREEDWAFALQVGEGIVAEKDGRVEGTVMACRHGHTMATLGMVIVDRALQGKGLGRRLLEAMVSQLKGCTIILQATEEGAPLYTKLGFIQAGTLHQHQGPALSNASTNLPTGAVIEPLTHQDRGLAELYSKASGSDREALTRAIRADSPGIRLVRDGGTVGFAMLRRFGYGWSIGPVVTPNLDGAKALTNYWLRENVGRFTRVDTSDSCLSAWLNENGLPRKDGAQTMIHGPLPLFRPDCHLFALTAQALG